MEIDAESLKEKLGIFGENHVMGFIIGIFIALFAKYDLRQSTLTLAVQAATSNIVPNGCNFIYEGFSTNIRCSWRIYEKKDSQGRRYTLG